MTPGALTLAALAGALSALSPCVLPLLPLVFGAAAARGRFAPALLGLGVAAAFAGAGLFVATLGLSFGVDGGALRLVAAALMILVGFALALPALGARLAAAAGPLTDRLDRQLRGAPDASGSFGSFGTGLLLGVVWSPCAGPTLGAASLLAASGGAPGEAALTMAAFGLGAAAPLLALGLASRAAMARWRERLLGAGAYGKMALGAVFIAFGVATLTGADKALEAQLVDISPDWLTTLTTRF
jgi:cytochrome c-type biogenesis protein